MILSILEGELHYVFCQGKRKTCAGHNFQYFDDYIKDKTLADIQLLFKE